MFRLLIILFAVFTAQIEAIPEHLQNLGFQLWQIDRKEVNTTNKTYPLSICAIFQNEGPFLKEWIEFHKLQGVEHFYLYNNNSQDDYKEILLPYLSAKEVTLIDWPYTYLPDAVEEWLSIQRAAYNHCLKNYGKSNAWLAVIDTDEFLFCPNGERLTSFLQRYTQYGGVCVNWLLFGTSNIQNIPDGSLMIELLTKCSFPQHPRNARIKSIVQPQHVYNCLSPHTFRYKGAYAINAEGNKVDKKVNSFPIIHDKIRINHYWTRTEEHFQQKKIKSRQNRRESDTEEKLQDWADSYNLSEDTAILQFVPALREKMELK